MVCHQAALVSGKLTRVYVGGQPTDALEVIMSRRHRRRRKKPKEHATNKVYNRYTIYLRFAQIWK